MNHYVYIIRSLKDDSLYKGYTTDYRRRLKQHNNGESRYTSRKVPWELVYVEILPTKADALKREKSLKHANSDYIKWLLGQPGNILNSG